MTVYDPKPADSIYTIFVERILPARVRPYARLMRLDRPIGWWLLLLPCWWSSALAAVASRQPPNLWHFALFFIGAVVMRGAGSTWNDIVDRNLDARVERTRLRPIPSGAVTARQAGLFMATLLTLGLAVLFCFNWFAVGLGFLAMVPVVIYPFVKRVSNHPQIVLGLAFAWGGLMGWAAFLGELAAPAYVTYLAAILWTVGYDTIYALQDIEDDPGVGIGSTALAYGDRVPVFVAVLYGLTVLSLAAAFYLAPAGLLAWAGLGAFALHLAWQVRSIDVKDGTGALRLFKSNRDAGLILTAALLAQALIQSA